MRKKEHFVVIIFAVLAIVSSLVAFISIRHSAFLMTGTLIAALIFYKPIYGLILYIVFHFLKPQDIYPSLGRMRVMLILAVTILLFFLIQSILKKREINLFASKQQGLMFLLLLIVPISSLANFQIDEIWSTFNEFLKLFIPFFIISNLIRDFEVFKKICWAVVFSTALLAVNGLIQYFRGIDLVGNALIGGRIAYVNFTELGDPNDFALVMTSAVPFALIKAFDSNINAIKRLGLFLIFSALVAAIYFTNSRGGFIALLLVLSFFTIKRLGVIRGSCITAIFILLAVFFAPSRMGELSPYEASAAGRLNAWTVGLQILKSKPLLGVGFHNFELYNMSRAAHSAFVECFAEIGLLGYFIWVALLYTTFIDLRSVIRSEHPQQRTYAEMLRLSLIGFLGSAIFLSQAFHLILYILIALSVVLANKIYIARKEIRYISGKDMLNIGIIVIFSIVAYRILAFFYYL